MSCCSQHKGAPASDGRQYRLDMLKTVYAPREINPNQIFLVLSREVLPTSSMNPSHPTEEVHQVLSAITAVAGPIRQQSPAMLNQFGLLQKLWPLIASWTTALLKSFVLNGSPITPEGVEFREALIFGSCSVSRLLQHMDADAACRKAPIFIPTILNVVIHLAKINHPAFETMWSELSKVIECRESLLQFRSSIGVLRKQYNIPWLITRMIQNECGNSYIDTWTLDSCLGFITHCLAYAPELNRPLRATNIVKWITYALSRIAAKRNSIRVGDLEVACPCLIYCCDYLEQAFTDGFSWVSQALDGHVILSMVKLLDLSNHPILLAENPKPDLEEPMATLVSALRPFLVYRSVLNRVLRELRSVRDAALWKEPRRGDKFWQVLADLEREAKSLKVAMHDFDADPVGPSSAQCCVYRKCSRKKSKPPRSTASSQRVKRCSGCNVATYCSRKCQQGDWRDGHRDECKAIRTECPSTGNSHRPSHLDSAFIRFLVRRGLFNRQGLGNDRTTVAQFDYRQVPTQFSMVPVNALLNQLQAPQYRSLRNELTLQTKRRVSPKSKTKEQIVHVLIPGGDPHARLIYVEEL